MGIIVPNNIVEGHIERIIYAAGPFHILSIVVESITPMRVIAKGIVASPCPLIPGMKIAVKGRDSTYEGEHQIKIDEANVSPPEIDRYITMTLSGIINGVINEAKSDKNISQVAGGITAAKVSDIIRHTVSKNPFSMARGSSDKILKLKLLPGKKDNTWFVTRIFESIQKIKSMNNIKTLMDYGFSMDVSQEIDITFGTQSIAIVKKNPFLLSNIEGMTFEVLDQIHKDSGGNLKSSKRIGSSLSFSARYLCSKNGDTYAHVGDVVHKSSQVLNLPVDTLIKAIKKEDDADMRAFIVIEGSKVYYRADYYRECMSARLIAGRALSIKPWYTFERDALKKIVHEGLNYEFTEEQLDFIEQIGKNRISILCGKPGTGKTAIMGAVAKICKHIRNKQGLCAPTGKAANNASKVTKLDGMTIHRMGGYKPGKGWEYNEDNKLDYEMISMDELSMLTTEMQYRILQAVDDDIPMLMVGDPNQLPSIGRGNIISDLIESKSVPVLRLNKVCRTDRLGILKNADSCLAGSPIADIKGDDSFNVYFTKNEGECKQKIINACHQFVHGGGIVNPYDIQVLTPTNKGELGTIELNKVLRAIFNPESHAVAVDYENCKGRFDWPVNTFRSGSKFFMAGDKIMRMKNNDHNESLFNGMAGIVLSAKKDHMVVDFEGDKKIIRSIKDYALCYASTIHKAQGSEFQNVIVACDDAHGRMLYRNLLYTSITRGQAHVSVVGSKRAINIALGKKMPERLSVFDKRIDHEVQKLIHDADSEILNDVKANAQSWTDSVTEKSSLIQAIDHELGRRPDMTVDPEMK